MKDVLNPDDIQRVLEGDFYQSTSSTGPAPDISSGDGSGYRTKKEKKAKPDHYEVICISLYREDLERLDSKVARLKASGHRKMSRSALIRFALDTVDVEKLPRSY